MVSYNIFTSMPPDSLAARVLLFHNLSMGDDHLEGEDF